jgi:hypothetical protein
MISSIGEGMYKCITRYVRRVWFAILIICKYGEMSSMVGILVILLGNTYCWCIIVNRPPLGLLYGCPWVQRCWVFVVVLLNIILYCGNSLCKYLVDSVAVSLVSCMATMEGGVGSFIMLSVPQFQDNILVVGIVCGMFHGFRMGWFCIGLESVKFGRGCRHIRHIRDVPFFQGGVGIFVVAFPNLGVL